MIPLMSLPTFVCAGLCLASSMTLSMCDDKLKEATNEIQRIHQQKMNNCEEHSDPQGCKDTQIEKTADALNTLQQKWAETVLEEWQNDEDFKRSLIEKILDLPSESIRKLLLDVVSEANDGNAMEVSLLGDAVISDIPMISAGPSAYEKTGLSSPGSPSIDPILLVTKLLTINSDCTFNHVGIATTGQLTGTITVLVGQGATNSRQIQVVSGSLTLTSPYTELSGDPIVYLVRKNGASRMTVGANGESVLYLDMNGSQHPFTFAHDENPIFEIPMSETSHEQFGISVTTSYGNLHKWNPWPISDYNEDGIYDNADIIGFAQGLNDQRITTDLNMDSVYDTEDYDLFIEYFSEDQSRWFYQSDRFVND